MEKLYKKRYDEIRDVTRTIDPYASVEWLNKFTFYSANLRHFIPFISIDQQVSMFRDSVLEQRLRALDQYFWNKGYTVNTTGWDAAFSEKLRRQPGIICSLHTGSFRIIGHMLARNEIPFAAVVVDQAKGRLESSAGWSAGDNPLKVPVLINAAEPTAALKLLHMLKRGISVLIFLDGDTGVKRENKDKMLCIPFLGQHLFVRKGMAYLAYKAGVPVYPIINFRQPDTRIAFFFTEPFEKHRSDLQQEEYAEWITTGIYGYFLSKLLHFPAQWDNWFYLHRQIDTRRCFSTPDSFPDDRYGIFEKDQRYYLLEKPSYHVIPLTGDVLIQLSAEK